MTRAWFILWAIVIWQVAAWTFAPAKPDAQTATVGDGKPYGDTEQYTVESRVAQRKGAMAALDRPWSERCGEQRKRFISGINEYYYQRQNQTERYPEIHGKLGADYIATQWSTGDDKRIERLTQEAYARGYLKLSDFDGVAGRMVAFVVKDERIIGKGCAG
jgi:hypothetical protein